MEHRLPYHDLCYIGLKGAEPYESVLAILYKFRPNPIFQTVGFILCHGEGGENHHESSALPEAAGILIAEKKQASSRNEKTQPRSCSRLLRTK